MIEIQHRFANASTDCAILGVPKTDEALARILMTYPSEWRWYVDTIALRPPAPTVAEIFANMKMMEERQNVRDEAEHDEVNYAGRAAGGQRGAAAG